VHRLRRGAGGGRGPGRRLRAHRPRGRHQPDQGHEGGGAGDHRRPLRREPRIRRRHHRDRGRLARRRPGLGREVPGCDRGPDRDPAPGRALSPMAPAAAHGERPTGDVLARVHREEHSRLLAALVRRFGDLDLAEDAAQEAMEAALRSWPEQGVPRSPLAWLTTVATRSALDRVRRDATAARRLAELHVREGSAAAPPADERALTADDLPDERLAMLMGCCHPAIAPADRIALMLRFVGALTSAEVAQALLLATPTLQARITRAKQRIAAHRIPLTVPTDPAERERRLPLVLTAISLIFTEGYSATSGDAPIRRGLSAEAIRLA